jgi:hypothetical protein
MRKIILIIRLSNNEKSLPGDAVVWREVDHYLAGILKQEIWYLIDC